MTNEQTAELIDALEREKAGYQSRIAAIKNGKTDTLSAALLSDRVKQVDAAIAAANGATPAPTGKGKGKGKGATADAAPPADTAPDAAASGEPDSTSSDDSAGNASATDEV